jgi:hypothetical protein
MPSSQTLLSRSVDRVARVLDTASAANFHPEKYSEASASS